MSQTPLIGIVCYGRGKDPKRYSMPMSYVNALKAAGAEVLLFPTLSSNPQRLLNHVSGLLLVGGGDIEPERFSQPRHQTLYGIDPERDALEIALCEQVLADQMPLLAICRGLQVVNVACGGDLIQHLADVVGDRVPHRTADGNNLDHQVRVLPGSQIAKICGKESFEVSSAHHQAIGRLGRGLKAVAWSDDEIIEAVEAPENPNLIAVQWHPEEHADVDKTQQTLFRWLSQRAAHYASR